LGGSPNETFFLQACYTRGAAVVAESNSGHADGTVVDLLPSGRGYRAVVEFTAPNGATIRFTSSVSSNPPPAQVGEHVDVR